jgi:hypothetical protein
MTDRMKRPVVPELRICNYCVNQLPVDPCDRFAFDNYPDCCAVDGEGHPKTDTCGKFERRSP